MMTKPPLGVKPLFILNSERIIELREAIVRYAVAGNSIPTYWVEEYNKRLDKQEQLRKDWENHVGGQ